ncbi:MAG: PaaI family thioesterase [Pseudomonadota bacterium]
MEAGNDDAVPAGYEPHDHRGPLTDPWEPIYAKTVGQALWIGLRAREAHCNRRMFVHGGLVSALADNAMGLSARRALLEKFGGQPGAGVTVSLTVDFLGSGQIGQWLEFQPRVLKVGKNLAFTDAVVFADETLIARANAVFRIHMEELDRPVREARR